MGYLRRVIGVNLADLLYELRRTSPTHLEAIGSKVSETSAIACGEVVARFPRRSASLSRRTALRFPSPTVKGG